MLKRAAVLTALALTPLLVVPGCSGKTDDEGPDVASDVVLPPQYLSSAPVPTLNEFRAELGPNVVLRYSLTSPYRGFDGVGCGNLVMDRAGVWSAPADDREGEVNRTAVLYSPAATSTATRTAGAVSVMDYGDPDAAADDFKKAGEAIADCAKQKFFSKTPHQTVQFESGSSNLSSTYMTTSANYEDTKRKPETCVTRFALSSALLITATGCSTAGEDDAKQLASDLTALTLDHNAAA